jgi:hypothetical protein
MPARKEIFAAADVGCEHTKLEGGFQLTMIRHLTASQLTAYTDA